MREITETKELQSIMLGLLEKIDAFCSANGIRYSLAGGTLIGAIRHKGFIPWDDDADIMMPRPFFRPERFTRRESRMENGAEDGRGEWTCAIRLPAKPGRPVIRPKAVSCYRRERLPKKRRHEVRDGRFRRRRRPF